MYNRGEQVLYGSHGVCLIIDIEVKSVDKKEITYYVLEPLEQPGSRYYIPIHNKTAVTKLSRLLSAEELQALLVSIKNSDGGWILDEGKRKQHYRELINSGDRAALLGMIRALYRHKQEQIEAGRKFHLCDENFLHDAEKLLREEFSLVLEIPKEQVGNYIAERLR